MAAGPSQGSAAVLWQTSNALAAGVSDHVAAATAGEAVDVVVPATEQGVVAGAAVEQIAAIGRGGIVAAIDDVVAAAA